MKINTVQCHWQQRSKKPTPPSDEPVIFLLERNFLSFETNVHLHPVLVMPSWLMVPPVMKSHITQHIQYIRAANENWSGGKRTPGCISPSSIHMRWQDGMLFFQLRRDGLTELLHWALAGRVSCSQLAFTQVSSAEKVRIRCVTMCQWTVTQPVCKSVGLECHNICSAVSLLGNSCCSLMTRKSQSDHPVSNQKWNMSFKFLFLSQFPLCSNVSLKSLSNDDYSSM